MERINRLIILLLLFALPVSAFAVQPQVKDVSFRKERDYIRSGNKLYNKKRFADAEVEYRKALQVNPNSQIANFNLASSLIRQSGGTDPKAKNSPTKQATDILTNVTKTCRDRSLASKAFYNLGNLAFNQEQYQQSVDYYKNSLRRNPDDNQARENLRLAQLKLKNQNKDKNKDKNKNKDKKKDKDKQNQNQNKNQQNNQPKPQPQPKGGISKDNVEQILKTMQDQEKATQQKVNAERRQQNARHRTGNQW